MVSSRLPPTIVQPLVDALDVALPSIQACFENLKTLVGLDA